MLKKITSVFIESRKPFPAVFVCALHQASLLNSTVSAVSYSKVKHRPFPSGDPPDDEFVYQLIL